MEKAGIKAFLLSAVIVGFRIFVGDQRRHFGLPPEAPLWVSYLLLFVVLFAICFLAFWLTDLWEKRREKKKMEKYMDRRS